MILTIDASGEGVWPGLARGLVSVFSQQLATAPLPGALRWSILLDGLGASDTRRLSWYDGLDPQGRLVISGRARLTDRPRLDQPTERLPAPSENNREEGSHANRSVRVHCPGPGDLGSAGGRGGARGG